MAVAGLYRRILPSPPAIEFASAEGKQLFSEALESGTMEGFFKLIAYFQTQSEPAYCGLASLSMVLNALSIDPGRKWKGPWRWFDESMLDCCQPLDKVKEEGITFGKVACLAYCSGAKVTAFHANQSSLNDFRDHLIRCTSSEDCHLITSYHRKLFKQTGSGHFSPIGGYHAGRDMALILDVARFKYPPHWVPVALLWEAMKTIDEASGYHRGFMLISKRQSAPLLYTLSCRDESWVSTAKYLTEDVPLLLKSNRLHSVSDVVSLILERFPENAGDFIKWIAEVRMKEEDKNSSILSEEEKARLSVKEEVLQQVHETKLFNFVSDWLSSCCANAKSFRDRDSLPEIASSVCCQGAAVLSGGLGDNKGLCCRSTCVKHLNGIGQMPVKVVSGTVISGSTEQKVDMLVPLSFPLSIKSGSCCSSASDNCFAVHPGSKDILTVLLLALPSDTWKGIQNEELLTQVLDLVSTENLPDILHAEVWHLREQLSFLGRCKDDEHVGANCKKYEQKKKHSSCSVTIMFIMAHKPNNGKVDLDASM
ncbi:Glutathione gamma-glutamylcysteinyltransferase 1 [Apostasia shenzhenica]|uniref:glutathione gamma-glutamylcysteinyltransferase n=1 Tax=Apostasia shenzhenica TaxID=1088818 RepID=A0A2I0AYI2_9ASPA|nr:Glutathione gamma-glutamylcysteinyltransferase 1 [Apostasia shenzhenica]